MNAKSTFPNQDMIHREHALNVLDADTTACCLFALSDLFVACDTERLTEDADADAFFANMGKLLAVIGADVSEMVYAARGHIEKISVRVSDDTN
ncbi:MAG: hypothetical protein H6947_06240 [Zoogloeaceae bacterium]|nr:hypothetical protein [Zoogloeaceae bacterium]